MSEGSSGPEPPAHDPSAGEGSTPPTNSGRGRGRGAAPTRGGPRPPWGGRGGTVALGMAPGRSGSGPPSGSGFGTLGFAAPTNPSNVPSTSSGTTTSSTTSSTTPNTTLGCLGGLSVSSSSVLSLRALRPVQEENRVEETLQSDTSLLKPPSDGVSSLAFSPVDLLACGSWDNTVRVWKIDDNVSEKTTFVGSIQQKSPILCVAFSENNNTVFAGGCDDQAIAWDLETSTVTPLTQHTAPVKCIAYVSERQVLITASWDHKISLYDIRSGTTEFSYDCQAKCYAMDFRDVTLIAGDSAKRVHVFDIRKMSQAKTMDSPLKYPTRAISLFNDCQGFALGTTEGRIAIHHIRDADHRKDFAFKCHRNGDDVYPINTINFHPYGTFATGGGDGTFHFWDKDARQRVKQFAKRPGEIAAGAFNRAGTVWAYAVSYNWSGGTSGFDPGAPVTVALHNLVETEIAPRSQARR